MATPSQIHANQQNAQLSSGPTSAAGKAISCQNHFAHGLTGVAFRVLDWEDQNAFDELSARLKAEHQPATVTEEILVEKMTQHFWLSQRAIKLQNMCFDPEMNMGDQQQAHRALSARCARSGDQLSLYIRYQTTHDRAFHKSLNELLKLRADKRKQEIGFESQKGKEKQQARKQAAEARRETTEKRKDELHKWAVLLAEAKLDHQQLQNLELDTARLLRSPEAQAELNRS